MNLNEIRQQFVVLSGRYDLVNDDDSDNGANFYIKAGQRYLDRLHTYERSTLRIKCPISSGQHRVMTSYVRSIKNAWFYNSDNTRAQLTEKPFEWLQKTYPNWGEVDSETPLYYAIDRAVLQSGATRVFIMPPPDADGEIAFEGLFYANDLENDDDVSFWSDMYPSVLVMAALRELEIFYRNTQGKRDWEEAIQSELHAFEMDLVEREIANTTQMEG